MKKQFIFLLALVAMLAAAQVSHGAAIVTYNLTTGGKFLFNVDGTTQLPTGVIGVNDGAVIQLGFYTAASAGNLFAGTWTPFAASHNIGNDAVEFGTVGSGAGTNATTQNRFSFGFTLDGTFQNPPPNTLLAVRVYNGITLGTSTFFNAVSSTDWLSGALADAPSNVTITLNFANVNAKLQSTGAIPGANISTTIPTVAPEPTSAALLMVGLVSLASRRRRVAKV